MWNSDPGGESFQHDGQWGVLVGTLLVLLAATLPDIVVWLCGIPVVSVCLYCVLNRLPWIKQYIVRRRFQEPDSKSLQGRWSF
jgi:hypothetical protein